MAVVLLVAVVDDEDEDVAALALGFLKTGATAKSSSPSFAAPIAGWFAIFRCLRSSANACFFAFARASFANSSASRLLTASSSFAFWAASSA